MVAWHNPSRVVKHWAAKSIAISSRLFKAALPRSSLFVVGRAVVAATLGLAILSTSPSVGALRESNACSRPCCAGTAMHVAGSCAGGACHAHLSLKRQAREEHLCLARIQSSAPQRLNNGLNATKARIPSVQFGSSRAENSNQALYSYRGDSVEAFVLSRPCESDCGAGANGFVQLRRFRDVAAFSPADLPRPPTAGRRSTLLDKSPKRNRFIRDQSRPRAPPLSS